MKKSLVFLILIITTIATLILNFNVRNSQQSQIYYNVYFDGNKIGVISSKDQLLSYIESKQEQIRNNLSVSNVYIPNGINIERVVGYIEDIDSIEKVYNEMGKYADFTVDAVQVTIRNDDSVNKFYITDRNLLDSAIESVIKTFVGIDNYNNYKNGTQQKLTDDGTYINSVYLDNDITVKECKISVKEKIYNNVEEIAQYLMYGTDAKHKIYVTSLGDTIENIAFKNEISAEEFFMANPTFTSANSLIYPGQEVTISVLNPQIKVVVEQNVIENTVLQYKTVESIDENKAIGYTSVLKDGENGILKVSQTEKLINGTSVYVEPISKEIVKPAVDKIIIKGGKKVSGVGSLTDWVWPTDSGWSITSKFSYRINPVTSKRELHGAIDIAGTGYGSPIYAANNGVVTDKTYNNTAGNHIIINHNNGYYTQYNHMSRFADISIGQTVEKGQIIGYVGMTGQATGPHLHFAVWVGKPWGGGYRIDPFTLY